MVEKGKTYVTGNGIPELSTDRGSCCGCSACYSICPVCAITMKEDEEGFLYPIVDEEKCIRCHLCLKVCVFKSDQERKGFNHV